MQEPVSPTPTSVFRDLVDAGDYSVDRLRTRGIALTSSLRDPACVVHSVFEGRVPGVRWLEATWSGGVVRAWITRVVVNEDQVIYEGDLVDYRTGAKVGRIIQSFHRPPGGTLIAFNDLFQITSDVHKGKGSSKAMWKQIIQVYPLLGATSVFLNADWEGKNAWARFGVDWAFPEEQIPLAEAAFFEFLVRHGVAFNLASRVASREAIRPWTISDTDLSGIRAGARYFDGTKVVTARNLPIGRAFLLSWNNWDGVQSLVPGSKSFQRAKEYFEL